MALPVTATAAEDWPKEPNSARQGKFAVVQVSTIDPGGFITEWNKPTPGVHLKATTRTRRGQPIVAFITFKGCQADRNGRCNVTVTYDLTGPSPLAQAHKTLDLWDHSPAPPVDRIQLGRRSFEMVFNGQDAPRVYRVRAAVTDHVAHITLRTVQEISVTP